MISGTTLQFVALEDARDRQLREDRRISDTTLYVWAHCWLALVDAGREAAEDDDGLRARMRAFGATPQQARRVLADARKHRAERAAPHTHMAELSAAGDAP